MDFEPYGKLDMRQTDYETNGRCIVKDQKQSQQGYFRSEDCDLNEFKTLIAQTLQKTSVPYAHDVQRNIPTYDMPSLRPSLEDPATRVEVLAEWGQVLLSGAGVIVLRGAYSDTTVLDEATAIFEATIGDEKQSNSGGSDHFAASGANDRVWNSLQKLCETSPEVFLRNFANTGIAAACEAWLGPNYQMTSQVNLVYPGGAAQQAHRDYHLGFQTSDIGATYPAHVHDLSPVLTLQGAIAHCDMPVESGPTKLLPFSQAYRPGYVAWRRKDFRAVFEEEYVQLPLAKGDAVFFSPALFHAAGANTSTDIPRMANLLQISSAFGRALENVDRCKMCKLLYPHAAAAKLNRTLPDAELHAAIAATAEGYSFPTNLDRDPPEGGLAPETQQAYFLRALETGISPEEFGQNLDNIKKKQPA